MPTITISVTDSGSTKVVGSLEESIYDIDVSGAKTIALALTPREFQWKERQILNDRQRLRSLLERDKSPLVSVDTTATEAELLDAEQLALLASIIRHMIPGLGIL